MAANMAPVLFFLPHATRKDRALVRRQLELDACLKPLYLRAVPHASMAMGKSAYIQEVAHGEGQAASCRPQPALLLHIVSQFPRCFWVEIVSPSPSCFSVIEQWRHLRRRAKAKIRSSAALLTLTYLTTQILLNSGTTKRRGIWVWWIRTRYSSARCRHGGLETKRLAGLGSPLNISSTFEFL